VKTIAKPLLASFLTLSSLAMPMLAQAQAASGITVSGNAGLFTDYRFRGFSQTGYGPAFQGGVDIALPGGFYVGNWNSNVEQGLYNGASLEMDFYGGYKGTVAGIGYDLGYIYYYYPNTGAQNTTKISNGELYAGGSYGPLSAKWFYSTTKFFSLGKGPTSGNPEFDTKGSWYLDVSANVELAAGLTLNAHYGLQKVKNGKTAFAQGLVFANEDAISDYKIGVTQDLSGWMLGAAWIGTSEKGFFRTAESGFTEAAGKGRLVLSVTRSF
jgi:uncharacterized protein (TIGR02001 family)